MVNKLNNKLLINAPAGSGKTTLIKDKISQILKEKQNANILCITYTNRAVDELLEGNESKNVQVHTIHSFINLFMKPYFCHDEIIELYFELYGDEIKQRIENIDDKETWSKTNEKYKENYGSINYSTIKKNIDCIEYNELNFNSLYYGGLSHDDLLLFSREAMNRFNVIKYRIAKKYDYIFIDEYQDTTTEVLKFFNESIRNQNTKLYLLGDRMQQIYQNYDGEFEKEFKEFDTSHKMTTNYRSTESIVTVLNNIYNDKDFDQNSNDNQKDKKVNIKPKVYISNTINDKINKKAQEFPEAVKLYVKNKDRFEEIEAINLYNKVGDMDKYRYGRKYNAVDILTDYSKDNPDELFNLLFNLSQMYFKYKKGVYGYLIQEFKNNSMFNNKIFDIKNHSEKKIIGDKLEKLFNFFDCPKDKCIKNLLFYLKNENIIDSDLSIHLLTQEDYKDLIEIDIVELLNLVNYLKEGMYASTQHGVKGEGYDTIFFICGEEYRVNIKIYDFFKLWSRIDISLTTFQNFYYSYLKDIKDIEDFIDDDIRIGYLKNRHFENHKDQIIAKINQMYEKYKQNIYFKELYLELFNKFIEKENVTSLKKLKASKLYRILNSYRIFYVGCSRAKIRLIVFVEKNKIKEFQDDFIHKIKDAGFEVIIE